MPVMQWQLFDKRDISDVIIFINFNRYFSTNNEYFFIIFRDTEYPVRGVYSAIKYTISLLSRILQREVFTFT